jgi:hypothetical protein
MQSPASTPSASFRQLVALPPLTLSDVDVAQPRVSAASPPVFPFVKGYCNWCGRNVKCATCLKYEAQIRATELANEKVDRDVDTLKAQLLGANTLIQQLQSGKHADDNSHRREVQSLQTALAAAIVPTSAPPTVTFEVCQSCVAKEQHIGAQRALNGALEQEIATLKKQAKRLQSQLDDLKFISRDGRKKRASSGDKE